MIVVNSTFNIIKKFFGRLLLDNFEKTLKKSYLGLDKWLKQSYYVTTDEEHTMAILKILKIFKFPKYCGTLE